MPICPKKYKRTEPIDYSMPIELPIINVLPQILQGVVATIFIDVVI